MYIVVRVRLTGAAWGVIVIVLAVWYVLTYVVCENGVPTVFLLDPGLAVVYVQ